MARLPSHNVSHNNNKKKFGPVNHDAGDVAVMNRTGTYIMYMHVLKYDLQRRKDQKNQSEGASMLLL